MIQRERERAVRSALLDLYDSADGKEERCDYCESCGKSRGRGGRCATGKSGRRDAGRVGVLRPKAFLRLRFPLARQRRAFLSSLFVSEVFTTLVVVPVLPFARQNSTLSPPLSSPIHPFLALPRPNSPRVFFIHTPVSFTLKVSLFFTEALLR